VSRLLQFYRSLSGGVEPAAGMLLALFTAEGADLRAERLGRGGLQPADTWWHAASLGEVAALEPLLRKAQERNLAGRFAVTTTTAAGRREARARWGDHAGLAPLDLPGCIRRAMKARSPRSLILIETELWPNWIQDAVEAGIPWGVVNGRLSDRSWPRYRRWRGFWQPLLARVAAVAARSEEDAGRWIELGAPPDRVRVTGNLKLDRVAGSPSATLPWTGDPVWTVGSLREGEERPVLEAFLSLRERHPGLKLVLAPRHPARWKGLESDLAARGLAVAVRSRPQASDPSAVVLLLDTQGELPAFYASSTICLVGGTLVPVGGHNPLEAAAASRPLLLGPHVENIKEDAAALLEAGGARTVRDGGEVAAAVDEWLRNPEARETAGRNAGATVRAMSGGTERTLAWLLERGVLSRVGGGDGS